MKIRVLGSNIEVGDSLTCHVKNHLKNSILKYFKKAVKADVFFSKNNHSFETNIVINEGAERFNIRSNSKSNEVYASFHEALNKASKQLRRSKNKIKGTRKSGGFKSILKEFS